MGWTYSSGCERLNSQAIPNRHNYDITRDKAKITIQVSNPRCAGRIDIREVAAYTGAFTEEKQIPLSDLKLNTSNRKGDAEYARNPLGFNRFEDIDDLLRIATYFIPIIGIADVFIGFKMLSKCCLKDKSFCPIKESNERMRIQITGNGERTQILQVGLLPVTVVDKKKVAAAAVAMIARGFFETIGLGVIFAIPDIVYHFTTRPETRLLVTVKTPPLPSETAEVVN